MKKVSSLILGTLAVALLFAVPALASGNHYNNNAAATGNIAADYAASGGTLIAGFDGGALLLAGSNYCPIPVGGNQLSFSGNINASHGSGTIGGQQGFTINTSTHGAMVSDYTGTYSTATNGASASSSMNSGTWTTTLQNFNHYGRR
jgi:hypothetical protein